MQAELTAADQAAELSAILLERRRLVRLVLWTAVATLATAIAGLAALMA